MSLTSYRAAPPRAICVSPFGLDAIPEAFVAFFGKHKGRFRRPIVTRLWPFGDEKIKVALSRPGSDLLSRVLRRSTMGAGAFHGRVRKGNGCGHPAITTRSAKCNLNEKLVRSATSLSYVNTSLVVLCGRMRCILPRDEQRQ